LDPTLEGGRVVSAVSKVVRVRYEGGVLKPLEPLELEEGEELLVKIIVAGEKRKLIRKHRGALGPAPRELLDRFMLEAEGQ
jgi:predicted DNA-binding antitoxin AbrB/MazE fold protein